MKALCWHGKNDIRYDTVPDPEIEDSRDAIIKMTVVSGMKNKLQAAVANIIPSSLLAEQHRKMAQPQSSAVK